MHFEAILVPFGMHFEVILDFSCCFVVVEDTREATYEFGGRLGAILTHLAPLLGPSGGNFEDILEGSKDPRMDDIGSFFESFRYEK